MTKRRRPRGLKGKRDKRGWLDPRRHHRGAGAGDVQCNCGAVRSKDVRHPRPHRMFGGPCKPQLWVELYFEQRNPDCEDCSMRDGHECQVVTQQEPAFQCPALRDLVRYEGIKLYGRAREQWERVQGDGQLRQHTW